MEWVASTLHNTSEHGVSSITTAYAHTSVGQKSTELTPAVDLNGLVRFAERQTLVSARVPSHFKRSLPVVEEIGWAPRPVWIGAENLASHRDSIPGPYNSRDVVL